MTEQGTKGIERATLIRVVEQFLAKQAGKKLIDIDELKKLEGDSKRIGVLNYDTIIDELLKVILTLRFSRDDKNVKKLFQSDIGGPLASLTHKSRLAYALGIIDKKVLNDFENAHKIRNEFAHGIETDFADAKVLKHVANLSICKGHKVTSTNSYVFYVRTINACFESLVDAHRLEVYRQAASEVLQHKNKNS